MRFVSQEINSCLENGNGACANFGLIFNKWLSYKDNGSKLELAVAKDRGPLVTAFQSVKGSAAEVLKRHHLRQAKYCHAMKQAGWVPMLVHAKSTVPFVSGMGMTHPTETGMVLDHTSGVPYIPASSLKGVLRLAHILNSLQDENGEWLDEEVLKEQRIIDEQMNWLEDKDSRTLFGASDNKDSLAGQLIILDAYPLNPPELGEEILNPHYGEYYQGKKNRGPTEDQSPNPVKYLVIKSGAEFVFRLLLRPPFTGADLQQQENFKNVVLKNIECAFSEVGLGAKTSLGFGRLKVISSGKEASKVISWIQKETDEQYPWRLYIRKIEGVSDWGQFTQLILDTAIEPHWQSQKDVAEAVAAAAKRVQADRPDKWNAKRDQLLADWLSPSGAVWGPLAVDVRKQPVVQHHSDMLERIRELKEWEDYEASSIKISSLDKKSARELKIKFNAWGFKKNGSAKQKKVFKQLTKKLKKFQ